MTAEELHQLVAASLSQVGTVAVAVSGGVDSMTLAHIAHRAPGVDAEMFHAVSAAVPREATERVERHAASEGWVLHLVDAGETRDQRYIANPVDRCFFCKTNLYGHISGITDRTIVSGTNTDDLGDYRPGLSAAEDYDVVHPFVEAAVDKRGIRLLADHLGLEDIAELPAAPCLASRIETGLQVTPKRLSVVDEVERHLRGVLGAATIRCRIRAEGTVIELDAADLDRTATNESDAVRSILHSHGIDSPISFEAYQRGSAFLHEGPS